MKYNNFKTEVLTDLIDNIRLERQKLKLKRFEEATNPKSNKTEKNKFSISKLLLITFVLLTCSGLLLLYIF